MHVSVTRVSTGDHPIGTATIVAEEMARWLCDLDGYEGFLTLSREGTTLGLTFWSSAEAAERQRALRMQFLERMTAVAGVEVEEVVGYEVSFAQVPAALLGPMGE